MIDDPDLIGSTEEIVPQPTKPSKPKIKYGIVVSVTDEGQYNIEILNKEECSLNELLGLMEIGKRKLSAVWDAKHDPTTSTIFRELDKIKKVSSNQTKALEGIHSILQGIYTALAEKNSSTEGDSVDDSATKDQVQTQ